MKQNENDYYAWWIGPVVDLLFTFPWILMFIGIPMPIAMGIYAACIIVGFGMYTYN